MEIVGDMNFQWVGPVETSEVEIFVVYNYVINEFGDKLTYDFANKPNLEQALAWAQGWAADRKLGFNVKRSDVDESQARDKDNKERGIVGSNWLTATITRENPNG